VVTHCAQCGARTENEQPTDHLNISPLTRQVQEVGSDSLCDNTMFVFDVFHPVVHIQLKITKYSQTQIFIN
jgi:hypothetical protein